MGVLLSRRAVRLAAVTILALSFGYLPVVADASGTFAGSVRDTAGNVLDGVEVLVVPHAASKIPLAQTRSDALGRFRIEGLEAGAYRIAAVKEGYLTFVGQIDTGLQRWVQLILHPYPALKPALPQPPPRASWAYRLPRRYLLDDVDQEVVDVETASSTDEPAVADSMRMQVDQLFALHGLGGGSRVDDADIEGTETRLQLASAIGERASIELEGFRQKLGSSLQTGEAVASARHDAAALSVGFSYDTGPDTQLAFKAFYGQRDLAYSGGLVAQPALPTDATRQEQRYWGYDAHWSKQLDAASSLALKLDYQDTTLSIPDKIALVESDPSSVFSGTSVNSRALGASGSYQSVPANDHQLEVSFRAQMFDPPAPRARPHDGVLAHGFQGLPGLSVGLNAQDTWAISGPFALVYGVGYKQAVGSRDASLIVPQLGGAWRVERLALRFLVSYHDVTDWDSAGLADERPFRPSSTMGYEAEVEVPLGPGLRVAAASSFAPIQVDPVGYSDTGVTRADEPIFLTDGNAGVRENRVTVVQESEPARTFVEFTRGSVAGTVAPVLPYEAPLSLLADRVLDYDTGRVGVRIHGSGTELLLEYQRLAQDRLADPLASGEARQRYLELRVAQDLLRARALGSWRLLMALSSASRVSDMAEDRRITGGADDPVLGSLNHRLSAGLSVVF